MQDTESFSVVTEIAGDERRVRPSGELDISSRAKLERALMAAESGARRGVVLDLRGVSFMDSAGVHVAVDAERRCQASGASLRVVPGPDRVQRLFRLTNTESLLSFAPV